jgi:hypothetical protein
LSIVGVHGVGQYKAGREPEEAAAALSEAWRSSLRENPAVGPLIDGTSIKVAYYAHLLRKSGGQGGEDSLEALDEDALLALEQWMSLFDDDNDDAGVAQGWITRLLRHDFGDFARRRGLTRPIMERFAAKFFGEVTRYLAGPGAPARAAVRAQVANDLRAAEPPVIVIAHSLGSVVAYETLWENPDLEVSLLLTLGSPLAMPHVVFPKLIPPPQGQRGARPPGVRKWINYADVGDLIAIPTKGIGRSFDNVDDDRETAIAMVDFHRAKSYLSAKKVGTSLAPHL